MAGKPGVYILASPVSAGPDWITLTEVVGDGKSELTQKWLEISAGEFAKKVSWGGYSGQTLEERNIRWGQRNREGVIDVILVASGAHSADVVNIMAGKPGETGVRVTRLDLQATVELQSPDADLAKSTYNYVQGSREAGVFLAGRRKLTLYQSDTGQTLYVGSRKSRGKLFRFYDKSLAYGKPLGTLWRLEVEYKRETAESAFYRYAEGDDASDIVASEFAENVGLHLVGANNVGTVKALEGPASGAKQKLAWLRKCVRPVVGRLILMGLEEDVYRALNIKVENLTEVSSKSKITSDLH